MSQTKLSDLSKPQVKLYNCWTCLMKKDIIMISGIQKVDCKVNGFCSIPQYCKHYNDGKDHWPEIPEGAEPAPKKWRGE